jgi:hypothetical protein
MVVMDDASQRNSPARACAHLALGVALAALASTVSAQVLQVGAAVEKITLPGGAEFTGVPLAGFSGRRTFPDVLGLHPYAHYFPPGEEARIGEEIRAKALVLEYNGAKLAFVSLDIVGIERALRDLIVSQLTASPLSFAENAVIVSATHTHSGPGALSGNHFLEFVATDRLHVPLRDSFVSQVVAVVRKAATENLRSASLFHLTLDEPDPSAPPGTINPAALHKNRSRDPSYADHRLSVLAARDTGTSAWIGALVNFAVHGTARRESNDQLSSDYPGALERAFAKAITGSLSPSPALPVLFLNGAEGDVTPAYRGRDMQPVLDPFAKAAWDFWWKPLPAPQPQPLAVGAWAIETKEVPLGRPFMYLRSQLKPYQDAFPLSRLGIELETYNPTTVRIWSFSIDKLRFMTIPGEATTDVGLELRAAAAQIGIENAWILGLTNDHLGYFTSRDDWKLAGYESGATVYGAYASRRLLNWHLCLLRTTPCL